MPKQFGTSVNLEWVRKMINNSIYCPVCGRWILADNVDEIESGENDYRIFVHDDVPHNESDMDALSAGLQ